MQNLNTSKIIDMLLSSDIRARNIGVDFVGQLDSDLLILLRKNMKLSKKRFSKKVWDVVKIQVAIKTTPTKN